MRFKRIAFACASLLVIVAGVLSIAKLARPSGDLADNSFRSDDLEVVASMPPLSDSIFSAMSGKTDAALKKGSYKQATSLIVAMSTWEGMTPEQSVSLRNSIQNLKITLGTAALEGDTNALAAMDFFKSHSAAGR